MGILLSLKNKVKDAFCYFFIFTISFLFLNFKSAIGFAEDLNEEVLKVVGIIKNGGGYYVGNKLVDGLTQTTWQALDRFITISEDKVSVDIDKLRPSFCSSACYGVLLKALSISEAGKSISMAAWKNLRPYTTDKLFQGDGVGCWGRANANGPGMAVLVKELKAGKNFYIRPKSEYSSHKDYVNAWNQVKPGDFVKIFWNENIGCNNKEKIYERGHMVVFLGKENNLEDGRIKIKYWSSNGAGVKYLPNRGYGEGVADEDDIFRAVITRITNPECFNKAEEIEPENTNKWLKSLDGFHVASPEEMLSKI